MSAELQAVPFFENPSLWRYASDAMKTTFRLFVPGRDRALVDSAVSEAFQKLEELEGVLSRYAPGSDISRINAMEAGETLFLSDECYLCLRLAIEASAATAGRFDPGVVMSSLLEGLSEPSPWRSEAALAPACFILVPSWRLALQSSSDTLAAGNRSGSEKHRRNIGWIRNRNKTRSP